MNIILLKIETNTEANVKNVIHLCEKITGKPTPIIIMQVAKGTTKKTKKRY